MIPNPKQQATSDKPAKSLTSAAASVVTQQSRCANPRCMLTILIRLNRWAFAPCIKCWCVWSCPWGRLFSGAFTRRKLGLDQATQAIASSSLHPRNQPPRRCLVPITRLRCQCKTDGSHVVFVPVQSIRCQIIIRSSLDGCHRRGQMVPYSHQRNAQSRLWPSRISHSI